MTSSAPHNPAHAARTTKFVFGQLNGYWIGALIGALFSLVIGCTLDDYLKRQILRLWYDQITPSVKAEIERTAFSPRLTSADSIVFNWLMEVFGEQISFNRSYPRYENQPFRIAGQTGKLPNYYDVYYVYWTDQCNNDGCRLDILDYGATKPAGTVYSRHFKISNIMLNGKPVLYDISGKCIYWNGQQYVSE